jgi:hypothetical protein
MAFTLLCCPLTAAALKLRTFPHCCRVWDAVRSATRTRSLLLFYNGRCLLHAGVAPAGKPLGAAVPGPICQKAMKSGSGNYLANLVLFPGGRQGVGAGSLEGQRGHAVQLLLGCKVWGGGGGGRGGVQGFLFFCFVFRGF